MKTVLGFLGGAATDYGSRLARLRWARAVPASPMELDPRAAAAAALAPAESWFLVRRPSALPAGRTGEVPVPPPGRVLLVAGRAAADPFPQTWRELQDARVRPCPGAASEAAALAVRTSEFPPRPDETLDLFVDRLLAGAPHAWAPDFAAIAMDDPSERERPEISAVLPPGARRMLDVGCGAAATSAAYRLRHPETEITGIERDPPAAARAREVLSRVLEGDAFAGLERLAADGETFDLILFGDVLEHLPDPHRALALARTIAAPAATLVASVPNVGHVSVVRDLLLGRFDPVPAGLLDAGHLRWWTRSSLGELLGETGWTVDTIQGLPGPSVVGAAGFREAFSGWEGLDCESLDTYQWLAVARLSPTLEGAAG